MNQIKRNSSESEIALRILSAASFLIFFQSYLVAPLIPALSAEFGASNKVMGLLIPAYMLPYGFSTLFYGPLSDRVGRKPILLLLLGFMVITVAGVATAHSANAMLAWRVLGGLSAGGIIPLAIALMGDLFPYEKRGHAMGWIFGAIAGGMAFGSTLGAFLNPWIGWRAEFLITAGLSAIVFYFSIVHRQVLGSASVRTKIGFRETFVGYFALLKNPRGLKGYVYIFLNGLFHSGVFSWLGLYFSTRYHLGDQGIGLALLGYGVPGMCLGPMIGHFADRMGRKNIIPLGLLIAALSAVALIPHFNLVWPMIVIAVLSLGYDMTHPLLVGIITSLDPVRRGQAMGLNAFVLFTGFGMGTLVFEILLRNGFTFALGVFAAVQLVLAVLALPLFKNETSATGV